MDGNNTNEHIILSSPVKRDNDNVHFIYGNEEYLKNETINKITNDFLGHAPKSHEKQILYGDNETTSSVIAENIANISLFSSKKVIILKFFDKLPIKEKKEIYNYIKTNTINDCFVLISDKPDVQLEKLAIAHKCNSPYRDIEIDNIIKKIVTTNNKQISIDAIKILREKVGRNLSEIRNEIEKLSLFIGNRNIIETEDVEKSVNEVYYHTIFNFTDVLSAKNHNESIKILWELLKEGEELIGIIFMMTRHFRNLWHAKLLQKKGISNEQIAETLNIRSIFAVKFFSSLKRFSLNEFPEIFKNLLKIDLEIKTGIALPEFSLELFILNFCRNSV